MMGGERERSPSRIARAVAKPSTPGIRASMRMTAKSCSSVRRSASSPDSARTTECPEDSSSASMAIRFLRSSSTTRMQACDGSESKAFPSDFHAGEPATTLLPLYNGAVRHLTRLTLIAALARNRAIGRDNTMPWRLPEDLRRFKRLTLGHAVIMGRKTFESIGSPLPGRDNIVITRSRDWSPPGCAVVHSLDAALASVESRGEAFVIGGAQIY